MPRRPDPYRIAQHARRTAHRLATDGDLATRHARDAEEAIGYSRPNLDGGNVAGGDRTSIVERAAANRDRTNAAAWWAALERLERTLTDLDTALAAILPATPPEPLPLGAGYCGCCSRWVSGSATDRLRAGLCDACRQAVRRLTDRDPTLDRGAAIARRRRALADDQPADG